MKHEEWITLCFVAFIVLIVPRAFAQSPATQHDQQDSGVRQQDFFGPKSTLLDDEAFAPARAWQPGMPSIDRTRIAVIGILYTLAAIGASLPRSRRIALLGLAFLTLITLAGVIVWQRQIPPIQRIGGDVILVHNDEKEPSKLLIAQVDRWQFYATRSTRPVELKLPLAENMVPVFCESFPADAAGASVQSDDTGRTLLASLHRGDRIATLTRSATKPEDEQVIFDTSSLQKDVPPPMRRLVRSEYGNATILGASQRADWTTVVIEE
jgi:hypothetical protein